MRIIYLITIAMFLFSCESETNQVSTTKTTPKKTDAKDSTSLTKLPKSMKGYEFYSWKQDNQWHFSLITGTNRIKTKEEIALVEEKIENGWVKITVKGVDEAKKILQRLESGTSLFAENLYMNQATLDKKIQDELVKFAKTLNINLTFPR